MKIYIISVALLLSVIFCEGISADVFGNDSAGIAYRSPTKLHSLSLPPPYYTPIGDTIDAQSITTIFITEEDRFLWEKSAGGIVAFPLFNKTDYLADFFFSNYLEEPNGYFRIIIHCHASVQVFIFVVEQMNLFEQRRKEYALNTLGITIENIDILRRQDTTLYHRFMGMTHRTFLWFELRDEALEFEHDNLSFWGPVGDSGSPRDIDYSKIQSNGFYRLPTAIPSDTMRQKDILKISVPHPDSITVSYLMSEKVIIDGRDHVIKKTTNVVGNINDLDRNINNGRIRNPRSPLLLYIDKKLDFRILWEIMSFLYESHLRILFYGVIPRHSYPPGPFPWTMQAVSLQIKYCLAQPTIIR